MRSKYLRPYVPPEPDLDVREIRARMSAYDAQLGAERSTYEDDPRVAVEDVRQLLAEIRRLEYGVALLEESRDGWREACLGARQQLRDQQATDEGDPRTGQG